MAGRNMYYGSQIFAGQRFFAPSTDAWNPVAYAAYRSVQPAPIQTVVPSSAVQHGYGGSEMAYAEENQGGGSLLDIKNNPTIAVIAMLGLGLFGILHIHFRKND